MSKDLNTPHRRYNPLTDSWVLVSPHRTARPWQGQRESNEAQSPDFDPECYLCPGNERAGGSRNPEYEQVFVFDNDYPALLPPAHGIEPSNSTLFGCEPVSGTCRVICYHPRHDLTLATLPVPAIRDVVDAWCSQHAELISDHRWVQIFENRGAAMGCSNPHPHGQIWATSSLPDIAKIEARQQNHYLHDHGEVLLAHYAQQEIQNSVRVVAQNDHWLVVVPWWAVWPFETLLIALDPVARIDQLSSSARDSLAEILSTLCSGYDDIFSTAFPYSMGWHSEPVEGSDGWRLHAHFYPPLLRSASVRKFMVGFEMLAEAQRDLTPEFAATTIREAIEQP